VVFNWKFLALLAWAGYSTSLVLLYNPFLFNGKGAVPYFLSFFLFSHDDLAYIELSALRWLSVWLSLSLSVVVDGIVQLIHRRRRDHIIKQQQLRLVVIKRHCLSSRPGFLILLLYTTLIPFSSFQFTWSVRPDLARKKKKTRHTNKSFRILSLETEAAAAAPFDAIALILCGRHRWSVLIINKKTVHLGKRGNWEQVNCVYIL
jgi:hypothetical protein